MQFSHALNPRRIARTVVTVLTLSLLATIAPPAFFPQLLNSSHAAPDGLNAYYRSDATGGDDKDLSSPFVTNTCLTTKLQTTIADWSTGGPTGGTSDCGSDNFTAYYTGYILGPKTGTVNFTGYADDVLIVRINGVSVVKKYLSSGTVSGSFNFTAGVAYPIQIWFHEVGGGAAFSLNWDPTGTAAVVGSSYLASTAANLLSSQYQTGNCQIGYSAACPAFSPQEIYNLYGTTTDSSYWIMTGGAPSYQYVLMERSLDNGGWILGMKANKTSTNFDWDDTYRWTTQSIDSATTLEDPSTYTPGRISGTGTGTDGKYEAFNTIYAQRIRAIFPEYAASSYGGRYTTNNNYGFMWDEPLSSLSASPANSTDYPTATYPLAASANCGSITTITLANLFTNSKRCLFRTPAYSYTAGNSNTSSYDPIGNNLFTSQNVYAFWGINYNQPESGGSPATFHNSRFGFGWNENASPNKLEGSNDVTAGIGLTKGASGSNAWPTGSYVGCCASQTGQNKQMAFEIYLRQSDPSLGAPTNLVAASTGSTSVRLSWNAPSATTATEYVVQYKTNSAAWDSSVTTLRILDPDANPVADITGLSAGTVYNFRVFARTIDMTTKLYDTNSSANAAYVRFGHEDPKIDTAFNFGANQFFASSTEAPFDIPTGTTFSLEAWVRPTTTSGNKIIAAKNGQYSLYMSNGSFGFNIYTTDYTAGVGGDSAYFGANSVKANEWQHVAFTRSGATFKFYYNGSLVKTSTLSTAGAIKDGSSAFTVGGYSTIDQPFQGQIDQVRVWSTERSLTDITDGMNQYFPSNSTGLVAAYGFNEGTGTSAYNLVYSGSNSMDLSLTGGTASWPTVATTSTVGPYTYVTFPRSILNSSGGWRVPDSVTAVTAVVVGGGGGGNAQTDATGWMSGGGGAGAYQYFTSSVVSGRYETVTVGLGGRSGSPISNQDANSQTATNGQSSKFLNKTSIGGGSGGGTNGAGASGGSGGGGGTYSGAGGSSVSGQGNNGGTTSGNCCASGGGGGAGGVGGNGTSSGGSTGVGGAAGDGVINPLYISGVSPQYIAAGGAGGGLTTAGSAGSKGGTAFSVAGAPNSGSGGGGGGGASSPSVAGWGGSGVILLRYITAIKPSFTYPTNAYLNVGMTETFTTNVAQDSATAVLTRTFRWESSTTGANGTFSLIKQGTGISNAAFAWVPVDTSTSGSNYVYRVIVTDSDTAGLFIQDTSTPVFAVINKTLNLVSKSYISKTVGISRMETFTVSFGTPNYTFALSPPSPFFWIDTATATTPRIRIADTATVGTYLETFTVTDSVSAAISVPITIVISTPPSFSAASAQVDSGTVLYLDAGNSASYAGTGTTVNDISGRGLNADMTWSSGTTAVNAAGTTRSTTSALNNITCAAPTYSGDGNGSLYFNGSSSCAYVRNFGNQPKYTYELWIKRNGGQTSNTGVITNPNRVSGDQMNWILSFNSNGTSSQISAGVYDGTTITWTTPTTIPDLTWTYVAVTYDGSTLSLYLNNSLSANTSVTVNWNPAIIDNGVLIGRKYNDTPTFNGSLASLRFYSRALTSAELLQNYNATKGRFDGTLNENVVAKKYASKFVDTYTVTAGSDTLTATFTTNALSGIKWDTSTTRSLVLTLLDTLTPGTYYDTITATDIYGSSTKLPITFTISKADTLTVYIDTPTALSYTASKAKFTQSLKVTGLVGLESGTATSATVKFKPAGTTCATGGYCRVGDIGPGGGLVFIDTSTARGDGRIWEVAPANWSGSDDLVTAAQYCSSNNLLLNANFIAVGGGETNTNLAKTNCLGGAVGKVNSYNLSNNSGYSDWFIPDANEAAELIKVADQAGLVFTRGNWSTGSWGYWTSTEANATAMASIGGPGNGSVVWNVAATVNKSESNNNLVRPVRAFKSCWAVDTCTALATTDTPTASGIYQIVPSSLTIAAGSLNNYAAVNYVNTNLTINKIAPVALSIPWINTNYPDTFTINFSIPSEAGNFTITTTNGTASGCGLDYRKLYTTSQGTCSVTISRAATRNFTPDTVTATVFFLSWVNSQPTSQVGSGSTIALNGATSLTIDTTTPPSITGLSTLTLSLSAGGNFTITGTGFNGAITVKFWRNKTVSATSGNGTTIVIPVADISTAGATSGRIAVITAAGQDFSGDSLTITP